MDFSVKNLNLSGLSEFLSFLDIGDNGSTFLVSIVFSGSVGLVRPGKLVRLIEIMITYNFKITPFFFKL